MWSDVDTFLPIEEVKAKSFCSGSSTTSPSTWLQSALTSVAGVIGNLLLLCHVFEEDVRIDSEVGGDGAHPL